MTEGKRLKVHSETGNKTAVAVFWAAMAVVGVGIVMLFTNITMADSNIWGELNDIMQDVYGYILLISTMVGVVAAAICLLIKMMSKSQRACEESSAWLKRIVIAWLALNLLGLIATWATGLIQNDWVNTNGAIDNVSNVLNEINITDK